MTLFTFPWLEVSFVIPLLGAILIAFSREPAVAARCSFVTTFFTLVTTAMAFSSTGLVEPSQVPDFVGSWIGHPVFQLDHISAPLPLLVAILHATMAWATPKVRWSRSAFTALLVVESLSIATVSCINSEILVILLVLGTLPTGLKLVLSLKPARLFLLHMLAFVVLLVTGWMGIEQKAAWGPPVLAAALLLRTGVFPAHLWLIDLFEHATMSTAVLFVAPLPGIYAAIRLLMPVASDSLLDIIGHIGLITAIYSAGIATIQRDLRRLFAYVFLSHTSLVVVGLESHTSTSLAGALALWFSVVLALTGLCLTIRSVEARFGRLSLASHHGLYEQTPSLAVCFLLTGLASVGFPGTLGFVAGEILVDGLMTTDPFVGVGLVVASAINGIAIVRAYMLVFTGKTHSSLIQMEITPRERLVVLLLSALILAGGLYPRLLINNRHIASEQVLSTQPKDHLHIDHAHGEHVHTE